MLKIFSETLVILVTSNCELFQGKIENLVVVLHKMVTGKNKD